MSKKGILLLFILFSFLSNVCIYAQTVQNEKQPLANILKILESKYNISFSFIDDTIKEKEASLPDSNLTLSEALKLLKNETNLQFDVLDSRFVAIRTSTNEENKATNLFLTQTLNEVIVTNYLTTGISKGNDGSITINPKRIGILPGLIEPDVLLTIQKLPGVLSVDETVSNINVRGGTHDQNLILWDGIKMYQSGHFFGLISAFNPYLTERVNVSKNGTSAKYGDGISSIVDMQLSNTIDDEFSAGIGFNLVHADGFVKVPLSKKTELQFSARRSVTDLVNAPTYDQYFKRIFQDTDFTNNQESQNNTISKNETFYFYDVTTKFLYDISKKDKVRFSFLNIYNNLNYEEESTINNTDESLNSKLIQRNLAAGLEYSRDWSSKFSTSAHVYLSNYDLNAKNFDIINDQRLIQENEVFDGSLKLEASNFLNEKLRINSGYQFNEIGISNLEDVNNPVFRSYIKEVLRSHSVFTEVQLVSTNLNTNVKVGGRLNYIDKFDTFLVEPRVSFSQRFLDHFRFEILGEFKSQMTSQIIDLQNDFLGIEKRRWILANDTSIPILKSKQASAGLHYNQNNLLISAEVYIKEVEGITTRSQGFQNQYQFVNAIGNYQVRGVDFLINKQFNKMSTWLSYSFSKNDYTFDGLNSGNAFPNNADISHAMTIANTYTLKKLKFGLGVNWHTGKPTTTPQFGNPVLDNDINYSLPNSSNIDDYLRMDLSATHDFKFGKTKAVVGASLWNVLNTKNVLNTYYSIDDTDTISKIENKSLGFTPNVSFRVNF